MPRTTPHQKLIHIHKPRVTERFLQISHDDWMNANKTLTPYGLQLYLYLASNNDGYEFALSPADAEVRAGIKSTSFHKYMKILEEEGYIVWRKGNVFDFYTSPREPKERTHPEDHSDTINFGETPCEDGTSHDEMAEPASRSVHSQGEGVTSHLVSITSLSNKEIDNRYIDMREDGIDKIDDAGRPRTPARPDGKPSELASKGELSSFNPDGFRF